MAEKKSMTKEEFRKARGKDVQAAREKLRQKKEESYSDRKGLGQRVADAVSETLGLHKGNVRGRKGFIVDSRKRIERDKSIPAREIKSEEMAKLEAKDRKLAQKQKSTDKAIRRSRGQRDILHGKPGRGKREVIPREVMSKHEMEQVTQSRRKRREMNKGGKVEMGYKKGGSVKSKSIDGIAQRGKTRGTMR